MMYYFPRIFDWIFRNRTWRKDSFDNCVYLSFDDGPEDEVTPWVLNILEEYRAKASFFCIGKNIENEPGIARKIIDAGHSIGNHTYSHTKGLHFNTHKYILDYDKGRETIEKYLGIKTKIFRPPYGKIGYTSVKKIIKKEEIIMWSILSQDYDENINPHVAIKKIKRVLQPGMIIVFHDSKKASKNLKIILPEILRYIKLRNWNFGLL